MNIDINTNKTFLDPTYRACRAAGMTAREALERSHYVQQIRRDFAMYFPADSKYWAGEEAWAMDTPEGRYEVSYRTDPDASTDDADCYSAEDIEALKNDRWWFFQVSAVFIAKDGRIGYGGIGGVDAGDHFRTPEYPLDTDEQIFAVAIDYYKIHEQARDEALAQPAVSRHGSFPSGSEAGALKCETIDTVTGDPIVASVYSNTHDADTTFPAWGQLDMAGLKVTLNRSMIDGKLLIQVINDEFETPIDVRIDVQDATIWEGQA